MVSFFEDRNTGRKHYFALSTDTAPVEGPGNGDSLTEIDTGTEFIFDAEGVQWCQVPPAETEIDAGAEES